MKQSKSRKDSDCRQKNVAKTGQYDKKQEKNVVCDEQLDYEVPKRVEGAEHSGRMLCSNYNALAAKATSKKT